MIAYFKYVLGAVLVLSAYSFAFSEEVFHSEKHDFIVRPLLSDLHHPWGMAFISEDEILITERRGVLNLVKKGRHVPEIVQGLPDIATVGQGGLLDVALHPSFEQNKMVYLSFAAGKSSGHGTEVARGRLEDGLLRDVEIIFRAEPKSTGGRHFGSRLLFDQRGFLYITLGDRGKRPQAQALTTHPGSIIRLHDDGRVPDDNPFVGRTDALPEIYTYGNRNVQGIAMQADTSTIWAHEHGPQGGDEVNIITAGTNYGWPVITYGRNYVVGTKIGEGTHKSGMAQPVLQWTPSIAPSGMAFYQGEQFPRWQGDLFVGSLKFELLVRLELQGNEVTAEERLLAERFGRIRDVRIGPDGLLYILTDEPDGQLLRLEPIH